MIIYPAKTSNKPHKPKRTPTETLKEFYKTRRDFFKDLTTLTIELFDNIARTFG